MYTVVYACHSMLDAFLSCMLATGVSLISYKIGNTLVST